MALSVDAVKKLRGAELGKWLMHGPIGISKASALLLSDPRIGGDMLFAAPDLHAFLDEQQLKDKLDMRAIVTRIGDLKKGSAFYLYPYYALLLHLIPLSLCFPLFALHSAQLLRLWCLSLCARACLQC